MAQLMSLAEAAGELVHDGDCVALEGFTHLIPFAAAHELIRQGRRDLIVARLTPDLLSDQLIGAGSVRRLIFSWGGNPGVGSLHRFRDAVEHGWPVALELEEHTHAVLANRYVAGASRLPFTVLRSAGPTDLFERSPVVSRLSCPFTGTEVIAVMALNPDVGIVHAQRADLRGNVQLWGITGVQKETVLASKRSIVTVEEVVDCFDDRPGAVVIPSWAVTAVVEAPGGARPSYAAGYCERDNEAYRAWDEVSRDRKRFASWIEEHIAGG
jgi:glutaconate CoA-transferase subunit A